MPYIKANSRIKYDGLVHALSGQLNRCTPEEFPGDLNYVISSLLNLCKSVRYKDLNELVGVLECAKLEFYRRIGANLEDKAIERNGDIYNVQEKS